MDTVFDGLNYFNFTERKNEQNCLNFCQDLGLLPKVDDLPEHISCPKCNGKIRLATDNKTLLGKSYRCRTKGRKNKKMCNRNVSVLKNTWFENVRLSILTILKLTFCFVYGAPVTEAAVSAEVSKQTAVDWYSFCREVCMVVLANSLEERKIGGRNKIVEIDEAHLCSRKNFKGRILLSEQEWIFGGICRESKESFLVRVPDRKQSTLIPLIKKYVDMDSTIITDSAKVYKCLESEGYCAHYSVCHKKYFVDPKNPCVHTNNIERLWRGVKMCVKSFGPGMVESYLGKYLYFQSFFRKDGKIIQNRGFRFRTFLEHVKQVYPGVGAAGLTLPTFEEPIEPPKKQFKSSCSNDRSEKDRELKKTASTILNNLLLHSCYDSFAAASVGIASHNIEIGRMISLLRNATSQLYDASIHCIEHTVQEIIHPAFQQAFNIVAVNANGDCFYSAISVCLFGDDTYVDLIRVCTLHFLLKYRTDMEHNRIRILMQQSLLNITCGVGISNRLFTEAVQHYSNMRHTDIWANPISILTCSIALGRPIYIYIQI